jgi:hypothetical protein
MRVEATEHSTLSCVEPTTSFLEYGVLHVHKEAIMPRWLRYSLLLLALPLITSGALGWWKYATH